MHLSTNKSSESNAHKRVTVKLVPTHSGSIILIGTYRLLSYGSFLPVLPYNDKETPEVIVHSMIAEKESRSWTSEWIRNLFPFASGAAVASWTTS